VCERGGGRADHRLVHAVNVIHRIAMDECIPNIGPRGQRQRMTFGIVALVLGIGLAATLVGLGVARSWRLAVFFPLLAGAIGVFQARAKT